MGYDKSKRGDRNTHHDSKLLIFDNNIENNDPNMRVSQNLNDNDHDDSADVMLHIVPENKGSWTHIEDLDSFFTRMYQYYVKGGFLPMIVFNCLQLLRYCFVLFFLTFLIHCVNYPVLFREDTNNPSVKAGNVTFADIIYPQCVQRISFSWWSLIFICTLIGCIRIAKSLYSLYYAYDIKLFYNNVLKINDADLGWISWLAVLNRVKDAQLDIQMCIHKQQITELDIYQRILRFNNYLVAMVNKKLLPLYFKVPLIGDIPYLSKGLKYNLELLLFYGPWSPWENCWHLRDCYKDSSKRLLLARQLQNHILLLAILNFLLAPLIQSWQILYFFLSYTELIKHSPSSLTLRTWSLYGRLSLRHFNELDHELSDRLYRAYKPASKYLNSFPTPILTVVAKNVTFLATSILGVLIILSVYDELVLTVDHMLTVITILGVIIAVSRSCIPEEGTSQRSSEELLVQILGHIHYLPPSWRGKAHTEVVATHFQKLFQYRFVYLLMELISPIICPFVLLSLRSHALDIVDFYRNFTVSVLGIGDVCSFAQMDINRHGNPEWVASVDIENPSAVNQYNQGEHGKIELSLVAFSCRNPGWHAVQPAQKQFLEKLHNGVMNATQNYIVGNNMNRTMLDSYCYQRNLNNGGLLGIPIERSQINDAGERIDNKDKSDILPDLIENSAHDDHMSISTLHLYDLHLAKNVEKSTFRSLSVAPSAFQPQVPSTSMYRLSQAQLSPKSSENTPLLKKNTC